MIELLTAIGILALCTLALLIIADSDDDNSGGGLMEPVLIPAPAKKYRQK